MPGSIRSMHLKHVLRDVQTDRGSLLHGRLLRCQFNTPSPWHTDAVGGRPPVGSDQPSTPCLEHHDGTCAPTGWPRRMPSRKSRHRAPVQGSAAVMAARAQYLGEDRMVEETIAWFA